MRNMLTWDPRKCVMQESITRRNRLLLRAAVAAGAVVAFVTSSQPSAAQSVWQKMKENVLQQQCQQGLQKACQALANMKQKQTQQGAPQQAPQPQTQIQQQAGQQQPGQMQPGAQAGDGGQEGTGAIRPPAGTKVEEKVMAPIAPQAKFFISPHGVHVATFESSGSRAVMYYDGVPGPKFDEILGGGSNLPGEIKVAFSPDGKRYGYCGRVGSEMVVMIDGKEWLRTSESWEGRFGGSSCIIGFSPNSKHVFLITNVSTSSARGESFERFIFDGKRDPLPTRYNGLGDGASMPFQIAFSPDGDHYAYVAVDPADENKWALVIDGKVAPYRGGAPQWSADSQHLYTTIEHRGPASNTEAMLDGKIFMRADHLTLHVAPAGNMVVALVDAAVHTPTPVQFLVVDGKKVPGSEIVHQRGGQIDEVTISPDGKHYAARFSTAQGAQYVFVDGKRGPEYQKVDHIVFTSAPSKVTYTTFTNGKPYAVIGDQESETCLADPSNPVIDTHGALMVSATGGRAGTICGLTGGAATLYVDGKTIPMPNGAVGASDLRFSPDGHHYAYNAFFQGGPLRLVIDGTVQMSSNVGNSSLARAHYVFSPDSQHIAADSSSPTPTSDFASGLFLDGKYIPVIANSGMKKLEFTADSKHIVWAQAVSGREALRIFVDGKAVAEAETAVASTSTEAWWDMAPDGSLSVLMQDDQNLKRITITPAPEPNVATLGGGGITVARIGN